MFAIPPDTLETARVLADPTRFQVYSKIAEADGPLTIKDLTKHFSLHHSAIRIHLHKLEQAGLVTAEAIHREGVVGRPEFSFRLGPRAINIVLPPRNPQFLAQLALEYSTGNGSGPEGLIAFGEEWGRKLMRERPETEGSPVELSTAVELVAAALRSLGCAGKVEGEPRTGLYLIESHCLFLPLSHSHAPVVCRIHQALIQGMLTELLGPHRFELEQESSIAMGEEMCRTRVRASAPPVA